jgi:predicted HicB family RNase H-like nuclease
MPEVKVEARISEEHLRAYEVEARQRGVPVAQLVQQTVNTLLAELERAEEACRETGGTS